MSVKKAVNQAAEILGGKAALAKAVGVSPPAITQWVNGVRPVPPARAKSIEALTGVSRKKLCPSFPW